MTFDLLPRPHAESPLSIAFAGTLARDVSPGCVITISGEVPKGRQERRPTFPSWLGHYGAWPGYDPWSGVHGKDIPCLRHSTLTAVSETQAGVVALCSTSGAVGDGHQLRRQKLGKISTRTLNTSTRPSSISQTNRNLAPWLKPA